MEHHEAPAPTESRTGFKITVIGILLIPMMLWVAFLAIGEPPLLNGISRLRSKEAVPAFVAPGVQKWIDGKFQHAFAGRFNALFGFRAPLVRVSNQLYYSLLERSFIDSSSVIIGKDRELYQAQYLFDYTFNRPADSVQLQEFTDLLHRVQEAQEARGKMFLYVTTPSKAIWREDKLPDYYRKNRQPGLRNYETLAPLLTAAGIHHLDAAALTQAAPREVRDPAFPKGGIHWSETRAFEAAVAIVEKLNILYGCKLPVPLLKSVEFRERDAEQVDADLARMLFVVNPPVHYPHTRVTVAPGVGEEGRLLAWIGCSFSEPLVDYFRRGRVFTKVDYFFYYTLERNRQIFDPNTINWEEDIFGADALILENNESTLPSDHLMRFLNDYLARLETIPST